MPLTLPLGDVGMPGMSARGGGLPVITVGMWART
jgi:hypothetical protein